MFIPGDVLPVLIFLLIMIPLVIFLVQRSRHRAKLQKEYDGLKKTLREKWSDLTYRVEKEQADLAIEVERRAKILVETRTANLNSREAKLREDEANWDSLVEEERAKWSTKEKHLKAELEKDRKTFHDAHLEEMESLDKRSQEIEQEAEAKARAMVHSLVREIEDKIDDTVSPVYQSSSQDFKLAGDSDEIIEIAEKYLRGLTRPIHMVRIKFRNSVVDTRSRDASFVLAELHGNIDLLCEQLKFADTGNAYGWVEGTVIFKKPDEVPVSVSVNVCPNCKEFTCDKEVVS